MRAVAGSDSVVAGRLSFGCVVTRLHLVPILGMLVACQAQGGTPAGATLAVPSVTLPATATPVPSATVVRTPPSLPALYQSPLLNPLDTVHTYVQDNCQYLRKKWSPDKAAPGTVVMVVMLRSINQGRAEGQGAMTDTSFARMLAELHGQRFEAINMVQLGDFLESNAKIPVRSVALIQDGRRYAENFSKHFRSYWDEWGWPVISAWDMQGDTTEALWEEQAALESEGWVDHQVYGPTIKADGSALSDGFVTDQLQAPMAAFRQRFQKAPIAVIWPSGLDRRSAQAARALGYRLGFTINPRGPLMFNWVPLADSADKFRPSYFPEGPVEDPLMTLPRYWPGQVLPNLDAVRIMGDEAASLARQNKATEMAYYDIVCAGTHGPIEEAPSTP